MQEFGLQPLLHQRWLEQLPHLRLVTLGQFKPWLLPPAQCVAHTEAVFAPLPSPASFLYSCWFQLVTHFLSPTYLTGILIPFVFKQYVENKSVIQCIPHRLNFGQI